MAEIFKDTIDNLIDRKGFNEARNDILAYLSKVSTRKSHPIDFVRWVESSKVISNEYNPNTVATKEMNLLKKSIIKDGYTQPIVTVYDKKKDKYVIIDGFHRTLVGKTSKEVISSTGGYIPIVVLEKSMKDRMAATVRHNRARGTHSVYSMADLVFSLANRGLSDTQIASELGMEATEVLRLKHITGYSALFKDVEYTKAWTTTRQLLTKKKLKNEGKETFDYKESSNK